MFFNDASHPNLILPSGLAFPQTISVTLLLILIIILILLKWLRMKGFKSSQIFQTIDDLPHVGHFPFWVPSLVDGLVTVYFIVYGGIKIWDKWNALSNHAPIFTIPDYTFSRRKLVVVNSPDLISKILNSEDPNVLQKPDTYKTSATDFLKDGLIASPAHIWEPRRKILNQILINNKNLPQLFKVINKYSQEMVSKLGGEVSAHKLCPLVHDTFMKIILDIALGPGTVEKYGIAQVSNYYCKIRSIIRYRLCHPESFIGLLWSFNSKKKEYDECIEYLESYISNGILSAKQDLEDNELSSSCAKHLLRHKISERDIQVEVMTLLAVGQETTDPAANILLQLLAEHPVIQEKCRDEIDSLFNSKQSDDLTMDDLPSLKYLETCILESLRIVSTMPIFGRKIGQDIELNGIKIEKGTVLVINTWLLHRIPDIYPEPEKYDPDRFLPEELKKRHRYAYFPFSSGPRNCMGYKMALMTLKITVAMILRSYRIRSKYKFADIKLLCEATLSPERKFDIFLENR